MELPRKSVLSKSRPSTLPNNRLTLDHKQFSDKGFQLQCQKEIISFFQDNCPEVQITIRHLQTPNTKDYILIFTSLMRLIDPLYDLLGKMEDEIPSILKSLGYPYTISKNSLLAVGAPNSWPTLLASLSWLVDSIKEGFEIIKKPEIQKDDTLKIAERAYELFLWTSDYDEELVEMIKLLEEKNGEKFELFEEYSMSVRSLQEEKERLSKQKTMFENNEGIMSKIRSHIFHVKSVMGNEIASLKQHEDLKVASLNKLSSLQSQLDYLRIINLELSHRIQKQEYSVEEITKVSQEITLIEQSHSNLDHTVKLLKETNSKNESLLSSIKSEVLETFEKNSDISISIPSLYEKIKNFIQPKVSKDVILNEIYIENEYFPAYLDAVNYSRKILNDEINELQREISEYVDENKRLSIQSDNLAVSLEEKKRIILNFSKYDANEQNGFGGYIETLTKELRNVDENMSLGKDEVEKVTIMNRDLESRIDSARREFGELVAQSQNKENELEAEVKEAYDLVYKMIGRVENAKKNVKEFIQDQSRQLDELYNNYVSEVQSGNN